MSDQEAIDYAMAKLQQLSKEQQQLHAQQQREAASSTTAAAAQLSESRISDDGDSVMQPADSRNGHETTSSTHAHTSPHTSTAQSQSPSLASTSSPPSASLDELQSSALPSTASSAVLPPSDAPRSVNELLSLTAKALVKEALDRRSLDNVTVMIIAL